MSEQLVELVLGPVGHVILGHGVGAVGISVVCLDLEHVGFKDGLSVFELFHREVALAIPGQMSQILDLVG